ncbi:MAG: UTP--glucose-1-phosphate uridylyltransferase GalU [Peptococcaceae bacterium]
MEVRKAVVPAAGLGVRFLPVTKSLPKEMLPLVDKPIIQYIIEEVVASGLENILVVTGRGKRAIEDYFDQSPDLEIHLTQKGKHDLLKIVRELGELVDIHYVRQKEPRGLGHAVFCARKFVGEEPFAVLLGDDLIYHEIPCLKQMLALYTQVQATILAVQEVPAQDVNKYGILDARLIQPGVYLVNDLVEKPDPATAPSRLAIMGRYIITPQIFELLAHTPPGAGGEIQLTDALRELKQTQPIYGLAFKGQRYDVGDKLGYLKATIDFALAHHPDLKEEFAAYLLQITAQL